MSLIDKVKSNFPSLTSTPSEQLDTYVYICTNDEWLLAVGKSTSGRADALDGKITKLKHTKAGICMMASTLKGKNNTIHYVKCIKEDLDKIESEIKKIVRDHYQITNNGKGGTYIDGIITNEDASLYLKEKILFLHQQEGGIDFNQKSFSLNDILNFVSKDGDAWSNLLSSKITKDLVKKFLRKD
jgi:hypothetical protein